MLRRSDACWRTAWRGMDGGRLDCRRSGSGHGHVYAVLLTAAFCSAAPAQDVSALSRFDSLAVSNSLSDNTPPGSVDSASRRFAKRPTVAHDAAARFDDDDDFSEGEGDDNQVTPLIEELFLGTVVYPQEQDEVQLTFGYFDGVGRADNSQVFFELEYGITDYFQIGFEVPYEFVEQEEPFEGTRNLGLELYYNFYSDRRTGRSYGVGFEFGLPIDSAEDDSQAYEYETFFVAYQEYCNFAVNLYGAVEIEDPQDASEATETSGDVSVGFILKADRIVPLLELDVEIASEETPVRLAPGLYFGSLMEPVDFAVSLPIGLNGDAPDFAVYLLAIIEFEAGARRGTRFR